MKLIPTEQFGGLGEAMTSEDEIDVLPLKSHKTRWSQRELLGRIVSRYFEINESLSGIWPAWIVDTKNDEDASDTLIELNKHLKKLNWMGKIFPDKPYVLKILPVPRGLFILGKKQIFVFWVLAFLSVWAMGIEWINGHVNQSSFLNYNTLFRSFMYYAVPLMGTLFLANLVQIYIAKRNEIRLGSMMPILFPIPLPVWPFGIIAIPNHPRMDSICWTNTKKMIAICLSGPAVMLICGTLLLILGIIVTPESLNSLNSQPFKTNPPLLVELLYSVMPTEFTEGLGLYWLHPIGLAGLALTLIGWISLLPIPTLAGGRILAGLLGIDEMSKVGTQISLMILFLLFGISYGFLEGNTLWSFIVIGSFMLLFLHGTDQKLPIILDESKNLDENVLRNFASIFVILLLLLLPAQMPLEPIENWNSDLEVNTENFYHFDEEGVITFSITNPSLIDKEIKLDYWLQSSQENITFETICIQKEIVENCNYLTIQAHSEVEIKFSSKNNITPNQTVEVILNTEFLGLNEYRHMKFLPNDGIYSIYPRWDSVGSHISPELCTNITNNVSELEIFTSPNWVLNTMNKKLLLGEQEVCVSSNAGFLLSKNENYSNPKIHYELNNTTHTISLLPALNIKLLLSPEEGWNFSNQFTEIFPFESNKEIEILDDKGFLCSNNSARQLMNNFEFLHWNATTNPSRKLLPSEMNGTLLIELPQNGFLIECNRENTFNSNIFLVKEGPSIITNFPNQQVIWGNIPLWDFAECINCSSNNSTGMLNFSMSSITDEINIVTRYHGDLTPWEINYEPQITKIGTNISISWNLGSNSDVYLMTWLDYNSNNLEIHLAAWSGVN